MTRDGLRFRGEWATDPETFYDSCLAVPGHAHGIDIELLKMALEYQGKPPTDEAAADLLNTLADQHRQLVYTELTGPNISPVLLKSLHTTQGIQEFVEVVRQAQFVQEILIPTVRACDDAESPGRVSLLMLLHRPNIPLIEDTEYFTKREIHISALARGLCPDDDELERMLITVRRCANFRALEVRAGTLLYWYNTGSWPRTRQARYNAFNRTLFEEMEVVKATIMNDELRCYNDANGIKPPLPNYNELPESPEFWAVFNCLRDYPEMSVGDVASRTGVDYQTVALYWARTKRLVHMEYKAGLILDRSGKLDRAIVTRTGRMAEVGMSQDHAISRT